MFTFFSGICYHTIELSYGHGTKSVAGRVLYKDDESRQVLEDAGDRFSFVLFSKPRDLGVRTSYGVGLVNTFSSFNCGCNEWAFLHKTVVMNLLLHVDH